MIKIGFSSIASPSWDLATLLSNASEMGYDGVEIRGLAGQLDLPEIPQLAGNAEYVRGLCKEHGVEIVCLGSSVTLDSKERRKLADQVGILHEYIELAARIGCPFVRVYAGEVQRFDNLRALQSRVASALIEVAPVAARHDVTVLVENGGDMPDSGAAWFLVDAVGYPSVQVCWNQCHALTVRERPTISIPRLGRKLGMVHLCDASFTEEGLLAAYRPLGEGDAEIARQIELLRGIVYRGYLMFEWPRLWHSSLAPAESVLPAAATYMRERLADEQAILTAYKGDKNPTRFRQPDEKAGQA